MTIYIPNKSTLLINYIVTYINVNLFNLTFLLSMIYWFDIDI